MKRSDNKRRSCLSISFPYIKRPMVDRNHGLSASVRKLSKKFVNFRCNSYYRFTSPAQAGPRFFTMADTWCLCGRPGKVGEVCGLCYNPNPLRPRPSPDLAFASTRQLPPLNWQHRRGNPWEEVPPRAQSPIRLPPMMSGQRRDSQGRYCGSWEGASPGAQSPNSLPRISPGQRLDTSARYLPPPLPTYDDPSYTWVEGFRSRMDHQDSSGVRSESNFQDDDSQPEVHQRRDSAYLPEASSGRHHEYHRYQSRDNTGYQESASTSPGRYGRERHEARDATAASQSSGREPGHHIECPGWSGYPCGSLVNRGERCRQCNFVCQ